MIGFSKSYGGGQLFTKQATGKEGELDSDELYYGGGRDGERTAKKVSVGGLTFFQMDRMYRGNVWCRAIVDKIVERTADIQPLVKPIRVKQGDDPTKTDELDDKTKKHMEEIWQLIIKPNDLDESFNDVRKKVTRDILKYDAGSIEIVVNQKVNNKENNNFAELYSLPGDTIKLNVNKKGEFKSKNKAYLQMVRGREVTATWAPEEIIYMVANPQSNRVYGLSPLESLIQTVTAELYASQYNSDFFYNNATPRFAVLMEQVGTGQANAALTRFRQWWDQELKGNPHRPIVLGTEAGNIKIQSMGQTNNDMQFYEYSRWLLQKIMSVYKMQPIVLGVIDTNMGKLNSEQQVKLFKQDAVKPITTLWAEKINSKVIFPEAVYGYDDVYLDFDLDLVDKTDQAKWHQMYLNNGVITINEIRVSALGLTPVEWGNVPYLQNNLVPFGLSSDGSDSAGPGTEGQAPDEIAVPGAIVSRSQWKNQIINYKGYPVGWENLSLSDRLEIVEKLIKSREKYLSKVHVLPKDIVLK
jgi:HK97 family phage portal protein